MLKLLKYELLGSYREYMMTFAVFLLLCIASPILTAILPYNGIDIFIGGIIIAIFVIILSLFVNIIYSFYRSMFKHPGYLTLTLPVSTTKLLLSKVISAIIWQIVGGIILILGMVLLSFASSDIQMNITWEDLSRIFEAIFSNFDVIVKELFTMLITFAAVITSFYFTLTAVHTKYVPKYKILVSIIAYFFGIVLLSRVLEVVIPYNLAADMELLVYNVVAIILTAAFFGATTYLVNHKIEVE